MRRITIHRPGGYDRLAVEVAPEGFDLVLDANGAETLRAGYRHLESGQTVGKLVLETGG